MFGCFPVSVPRYTCKKGLDLVSPSTSIFSGLFGDEERLNTNYKTFDDLLSDAATGTLPAYSVVEPQYISLGANDLHNDMHPGELTDSHFSWYIRPPIWKAEDLILSLYEGLFVKGKNPHPHTARHHFRRARRLIRPCTAAQCSRTQP